MAKIPKEITVTLDVNMNKLQSKLRSIAKHAEELANELEAIDNEDDELPTRPEGSE